MSANRHQTRVWRAVGQHQAIGVKLMREVGPKGFFRPKGHRGAAVLTPPTMEQVQTDLNHGKSVAEIADTQKVKPDTIQKAIQDGRLKRLSDEGEKKKKIT